MEKSSKQIIFLLVIILLFSPFSFILAQHSSKSNTISINGIDLYYEIHGNGTPLLMLHGWGLSHQAWESYIPELSKHFQLIIPDLRGHGRSTYSNINFTFKQSAVDMFSLIDHLKINRIKGIGFSGGAMTLIHMATQQPSRIESMILMSGAHYWPEQCRAIFRQSSPDSLTEEQWDMICEINNYSEEQARWLQTQFYEFKDSYSDMNFTPPYLSTITARTLVFHGDRDKFFPIQIAMELYQNIPNSYLWIMPNHCHSPLVGENLNMFIIKVKEFLRGFWESNNK